MDECRRRPWNHRQRKSACPSASATQWCFSICLAKTSQHTSLILRHPPPAPTPHTHTSPSHRYTAAKKTRRVSRCPVCWLESLLNVKGKEDKKNETETERTLCCWILVKDASRVCDSVINLVKLWTEQRRQQNQRLLTEKRTRTSHFSAAPKNLKCIQMGCSVAALYITWMETYHHKIVMRRSLFPLLQRSGITQLN